MIDELKERMRQSGIRQKEIAEACNISQPAVSRWFERRVPAEHVKRVSELTGIPPHELRPDIF